MNKVIFMVGSIGAGKSSYVNSKYPRLESCLCKDELRKAFAATIGEKYIWDEALEEIIQDVTLDFLEGMLHIGTELIILDETFMTKEHRSSYLYLSKKYEYQVGAVIFKNMGKEVHVDNRMNSPRGMSRQEWEIAWEDFNAIYEPPTFEEGFDKIYNYSWR